MRLQFLPKRVESLVELLATLDPDLPIGETVIRRRALSDRIPDIKCRRDRVRDRARHGPFLPSEPRRNHPGIGGNPYARAIPRAPRSGHGPERSMGFVRYGAGCRANA